MSAGGKSSATSSSICCATTGALSAYPPRAIASQIGVGAGLIAQIETGTKKIEALPADRVAAWIRLVGVDPGAALTALQRSQHPGGDVPASHDGAMCAAPNGRAISCQSGWIGTAYDPK